MGAPPERILTIYFRHQRGGLNVRLYTLIEALVARGVEVHVVSAAPLAIADHAGLVRHRVPWGSREPGGLVFWLWFTLAAPWVLARVALAVRPRALVVFDPYYAVVGRLAARFARMPVVLFVRAIPWRARMRLRVGGLRWRVATLLDVFALRSSEHVVTITRSMIAELAAHAPGLEARCEVLPNALRRPRGEPVDRASARAALVAATGWPHDSLVLATAGVLSERKNLGLLLDALAGAPAERLRLVIAGDGPSRDRLARAAADGGVAGRVHFTGWLEDPLAVVMAADLFVLPSVHEGTSNALLEAWGAGIPVFAARTPESVDVLADEALLFDGADPGELARLLAGLADDPAELDRRARISAARAAAFDFDWGERAVELVSRLARP